MKYLHIVTYSRIMKLIALIAFVALMGKFASAQCNAGFTYTINQATRTVTFTNTSTHISISPSFQWYFGDASPMGTSKNPVKTYSANGTYMVCMYVIDSFFCSDSACAVITITGGSTPCIANFTYNMDSSVYPPKFNFNSSGSSGNNLTYLWTFGNSTSSTLANPSKQYSTPGTYNVCLTVRNALDSTCAHTKCTTITSPAICKAQFNFTIDSSTVPRKYNFNSSGSTGWGTWTRTWDFGDGNTSTSAHPVHQYTNPGTYNVCLKVKSTTDTTCQDQKCTTIVVPPYPCNAKALWTKDSTVSGKVNFTHQYPRPGLIYNWTFGDGGTSTLANPNHTYLTNGWFMYCLTIRTADSSCMDTKCDSIYVNALPPCVVTVSRLQDTAQYYVSHFTASTPRTGVTFSWQPYLNGVPFGPPSSTGTANTQSHAFITSGWRKMCVTMRSFDSSCIVTACSDSFYVGSCMAAFQMKHDSLVMGKINFTNTSTSSTSGLQYLWTFGDGDSSTAQHPSHQYSSTGAYKVCLKVTSSTDTSCHSTRCDSVFVLAKPCTAEFGIYFDTIPPYSNVHFFPLYGKPGTTFSWTFGDGDTSTAMLPSHNYTSGGYKLVCLTVHNTMDSCHATWCDTIYVPTGTGEGEQASAFEVLNVYPNPFTDRLQLDLNAQHAQSGELAIVDITGRIHYRTKATLNSGINHLDFDLGTLTQGVYLLELKTQEHTVVKRIVK